MHTGNYISDATGVIFNERQYNLPVKKDVWDESKKRIKARNFAIFAPTGEGKSIWEDPMRNLRSFIPRSI